KAATFVHILASGLCGPGCWAPFPALPKPTRGLKQVIFKGNLVCSTFAWWAWTPRPSELYPGGSGAPGPALSLGSPEDRWRSWPVTSGLDANGRRGFLTGVQYTEVIWWTVLDTDPSSPRV